MRNTALATRVLNASASRASGRGFPRSRKIGETWGTPELAEPMRFSLPSSSRALGFPSITLSFILFLHSIEAIQLLRTAAQDFSCRNAHSSQTVATAQRRPAFALV